MYAGPYVDYDIVDMVERRNRKQADEYRCPFLAGMREFRETACLEGWWQRVPACGPNIHRGLVYTSGGMEVTANQVHGEIG